MFRLLACLLLVAALASGCSDQDRGVQAVAQVMKIRSDALNSRNSTLYLSVVSPRYSDKGKDFSQLKESIITNFMSFENVSYQSGEQSITIDGNYARASGTYRMKVVVKGREVVLDGVENLKFSKESDGWKFIAGL